MVIRIDGGNNTNGLLMQETWLRSNRRALWFGMILPLCAGLVGVWFIWQSGESGGIAVRWAGIALVVFGIATLGLLVRMMLRPPISYRQGQVLFRLRSGEAIAVPVNVVEAFFVGQGPAQLPGGFWGGTKTYNLVARLSQREKDWAQRDVKPALGNWSEGYVTIRGTWCEPLDDEVVRRLNRRLKEVKTDAKRAN